MILGALVFFLSLLISIYGTPIVRNISIRYGILDKPDGILKNQPEPVPYLGGISVFVSFLIPLLLIYDFDKKELGMLLGGSIIIILGLIDDIGGLTPYIKFFGQILATYIMIKSGVFINIVFVPTPLNYIVTFLWIIGTINAFNFIDIIDGFASGIAIIASAFLLFFSIINGKTEITIFCMALIGSILGFLKYNYPPASIYLGDTGAMFIGFILGSLMIPISYTKYNFLGFINPLLILGIPLFEIIFVSLIRISKGKSPLIGSKDHFPLRLKRKFNLTTKQLINILFIIGFILGLLSIFNYHLTLNSSAILLSVILIIFILSGIMLSKIKME